MNTQEDMHAKINKSIQSIKDKVDKKSVTLKVKQLILDKEYYKLTKLLDESINKSYDIGNISGKIHIFKNTVCLLSNKFSIEEIESLILRLRDDLDGKINIFFHKKNDHYEIEWCIK